MLHSLLRTYDLMFELFIDELWQTAAERGLSQEKTDAWCCEVLE